MCFFKKKFFSYVEPTLVVLYLYHYYEVRISIQQQPQLKGVWWSLCCQLHISTFYPLAFLIRNSIHLGLTTLILAVLFLELLYIGEDSRAPPSCPKKCFQYYYYYIFLVDRVPLDCYLRRRSEGIIEYPDNSQ